MSGQQAARALAKILTDNPELTVVQGRKHRKLYLDGHLIASLPHSLHQGGLAPGLLSSLRRRGLKV